MKRRRKSSSSSNGNQIVVSSKQRVYPKRSAIFTTCCVENGKKKAKQLSAAQRTPTPVVIMTYNRPEYLTKTMDTVFRYLPKHGFDVYVSQDGFEPSIGMVAGKYSIVEHFHHPRNPPQNVPPGEQAVYHMIAAHYGWAINEVFKQNPLYKEIIILEEDLQVAPDFFDYFDAMREPLHEFAGVYCVSAFNDNGLPEMVRDPRAVHLSDFFPGLGWMMSRKMWDELGPKWPRGYWDDWMRLPEHRKRRHCIRPEVSRTTTFGAKGASSGQFFESHLAKIHLNDKHVSWDDYEVKQLRKDVYDDKLDRAIAKAQQVFGVEDTRAYPENTTLLIRYNSWPHLRDMLESVGAMTDEKAGVPRTAYRGIVSVWYENRLLYFAPQPHVRLYDF